MECSKDTPMDPTTSPESAADSPVTADSNPLSTASPYWLHRLFLGLSGIALAQWLWLGQAALMMIIYFLQRTRLSEEDRLIYFIPNVNYVSFSVLWFSAIYLLAAPESKRDQAEEGIFSARILVIYLGCATALLIFFPSTIYPLRSTKWMAALLPILNLAANLALLLYLFKLADRAQDAQLKKQVPLALAVMLLSNVFSIADQFEFVKAEDVRLVLSVAATIYLLYVVLRLRKIFANILGDVVGE